MSFEDTSGGAFDQGGSAGVFDPYGNPLYAQVSGSVSVPQAPAPGQVVSDWTRVLDTAARGIATGASAFASISATRAASAAAADSNAIARFERDQSLQLRRAELEQKTELGKLGYAVELSKARAVAGIAGSPGASILYQLANAPSQSWTVWVIVGVGIWLVYTGLKK